MSRRPKGFDLLRELRDREFRARFFQSEVEHKIPEQIRSLRKLRRKTQEMLAAEAGMQQSSICRCERSSYAKWKIETLQRIAEALDARLVVSLEPSEVYLTRLARQAARASKPESTCDKHTEANAVSSQSSSMKSTPRPLPKKGDAQEPRADIIQ